MSDAREVNFDGLVGPTHNYAGLSHGNVASMTHGGAVSNPREAALQGLAKMRLLADLGVPQAVLPPPERPAVHVLRALGFSGSDAQVIARAGRETPQLLAAVSSASAMWAANAATVAPSADTPDGRMHVTPANLVAKFHRSLEAAGTTRALRAVFHDEKHFVVHDPLPAHAALADEGAANHTRLCRDFGGPGLHLFVHGRSGFAETAEGSRRFPPRQTREASEAVARLHGLRPAAVMHVAQSPEAIDAGVFHNDVISVGHQNVFLYHEQAFVETPRVIDELRRRFAAVTGGELTTIEVPAARVSLVDAVSSYLFNSQLVTLPDGAMLLLAPAECRESPAVAEFLEELVSKRESPIRRVQTIDLRQSMRNGGGPACLRLRVVLTAQERAALPAGIWMNPEQHARLEAWVKRHYRDRLAPQDLADPQLREESKRAGKEFMRSLNLNSALSK